MESQEEKKNLKQKLIHEFTEYFVNVAYLTLFFSAIIFYRRLLLAEHGIILEDYFMGVIKALVIGKVIMIGAFLSFSRKFENRPLIIPTLYKTMIFTLLVLLFDIAEIFIVALFNNPDLGIAFNTLCEHINMVWFGVAMVICVSFLPFFAMKELSRVMGKKNFSGLFFKKQ